MVDPASVGATGEPFVLEVERGKLREFARATFTVPPGDWSLPTFLTTAFHWQSGAADPWEAVRMDPARGLHAEQEFVFHGPPPRAGDTLIGVSTIESVTDKQGRRGGTMTFAVMRTEFRDPSGRLVAETRLTGVETAQAPT
ncbi:MAG: MaoC family dehydratase N-terminal domain-containing protein [Actinomycetota bacterium]|nr:MaoC family dehydratase N-terminal domain-containing protein [Actinomycetota bacterium]